MVGMTFVKFTCVASLKEESRELPPNFRRACFQLCAVLVSMGLSCGQSERPDAFSSVYVTGSQWDPKERAGGRSYVITLK